MGVDITPLFNRSVKRRCVRNLDLVNMFAKSHAALRAYRSWIKVSSCDISSSFGAQGFRFTFLDNASRWSFSFPNLNFVPSASWDFCSVSRRSVQSRLPNFPQNRLLWIWIFEIHNLGPFSFQNRNCSLNTLSCWVSPHQQHVHTHNYCHGCTCFQTCDYDTREDVNSYTTLFCILRPWKKNFSSNRKSGL